MGRIPGPGVTGFYRFDIQARGSEESSPGFGAEGIALLESSLRNELGLRLRKSTSNVKYYVVDQIERPSEN